MSPLSRFRKLDPSKREGILDAASAEFGSKGYDGASLNRIIAAAKISKGAMYYYFEDKADLFVTVSRRLEPDVPLAELGFQDVAGAQEFWTVLHDLFVLALNAANDNPNAMGLGKAFYSIPKSEWFTGAIGEYIAEILAKVGELFELGQSVGAVRTSPPTGVLVQMWFAMNEVLERWALDHWEAQGAEGRLAMVETIIDIYRGAFGPESKENP